MKETPTSAVNRDDDSLGSPAIKLFKPVTPRKLGIKCPQSLRNRVQSTCLDDAAHLKTYMRMWLLVEVLLLYHDPWLIPQGGFTKFVYPQLAAFALAFLERARRPKLPHPRRGRVFLEEVCGRRAGIAARAGRMARQSTHLFPLAGARGPRRAALH